jgi:hypothetical protein
MEEVEDEEEESSNPEDDGSMNEDDEDYWVWTYKSLWSKDSMIFAILTECNTVSFELFDKLGCMKENIIKYIYKLI